MKTYCFALLFAATSFLAGSEELSKARVAVYFDYEQPPSEHAAALIQSGVEAILSPLGFDVQWRQAGPGNQEVWSDLAFVSFRGRCGFGSPPFGRFVPGALGWAEAIHGEIQPFVEIDCSRIGALLQTQLPSAPKSEALFARAVARVVSHELYHVFANTDIHGVSGVGRAEFTARDLLSGDFRFEVQQARTLRMTSAEDAQLFHQPGK
ncbi:MAG TPA: hypothetical protein VGF16_09340 [Bryobacteraceae bacterium]|jgi:hypothetical protein